MITNYFIVAIVFMLGLSFVATIHFLWLRDASKEEFEPAQEPIGFAKPRNAESSASGIGGRDLRNARQMRPSPTVQKLQISESKL